MALSKATKAALGTAILALASAALMGQAPEAGPSITVYKSPT